jgi:hypothetical protein
MGPKKQTGAASIFVEEQFGDNVLSVTELLHEKLRIAEENRKLEKQSKKPCYKEIKL